MTGSGAPIELTDVALAYRLCRDQSPSFKEHIFGLMRRQISYEQHWALRGVSVSVRAGELLTVIGPNGAGKTTMLKVIARVLPPTRGRVIVRGQIAPMIELGAGFNAELTGAENILLYGTLLGHRPNELRKRVPEIAAFAELEDYMDVPLRSYSSGMLGRLAFAIATYGEPEVVLIDEILAVGDEAFRQRSDTKIGEIISRGTAVVLVTHALEVAREMADTVLWLDHGRVVEYGDPDRVIDNYREAARAGRSAPVST